MIASVRSSREDLFRHLSAIKAHSKLEENLMGKSDVPCFFVAGFPPSKKQDELHQSRNNV